MKTLHLFSLLAGLFVSSVAAEGVQHETFAYGEHRAFEKGCELAEEALKRRVVAQECGSLMTGGAMRALGETADILYRLHFETTGGRVTAYEFIDSKNEGFSCTVRAKLTVQCDKGQRDPAFLPAAETLVKLNETVFRAGEHMKISVRIPDDIPGQVHLNVVVLMPYEDAAHRVARLYPNEHETAKPFSAGNVRRIPGDDHYNMTLDLPKGRKSAEEALMFIFSRRPVSLPAVMSIEQLHGILAEIPLGDRREWVTTYRIEARAER